MSAGSGAGSSPSGSASTVGERAERAGFAGHEDLAQGRRLRADRGGQLAVVEAAVLVGDDVGDGFGEAGEVADLGDPVGGQRQDGDRPQAHEREEQHDELAAVGQLDEHPVAGADAARPQAGGHAVGAVIELGVAQALAAGIDERGARTVRGGQLAQQRAERPAAPEAGGAVLGGELGRPRGQAGGQRRCGGSELRRTGGVHRVRVP